MLACVVITWSFSLTYVPILRLFFLLLGVLTFGVLGFLSCLPWLRSSVCYYYLLPITTFLLHPGLRGFCPGWVIYPIIHIPKTACVNVVDATSPGQNERKRGRFFRSD